MPHLLLPVVTEPKKAVGALKWAVNEMEQRYKKMAKFNARDLARYNSLQTLPEDKLPKIVIIVDEFADLMMVASREVEDSVRRIAQLGRASGIHLIIATQSPRADVITGLIKSNIQSRITLTVSSGLESRIILDENGAEQLLGKGDLLFHASGANKPLRAQGAYVSDEEVEAVMGFFAQQHSEPKFEHDMLEEIESATSPSAQGNGKQEDDLLPDAVKIVLDSGQASISMIQRRLRVGYARAARLIDIMEQKGIVSGFDGAKPRKILIDQLGYERIFGNVLSEDE
jgi:S-DNA-T family DNA segregation ATPase FtsK/SpoIIIE